VDVLEFGVEYEARKLAVAKDSWAAPRYHVGAGVIFRAAYRRTYAT
jgi:hypothetical protein